MWIISAATITVDFYSRALSINIIRMYLRIFRLSIILHDVTRNSNIIQRRRRQEELLLHVITALVHNGAFLLVDAINPDGSIVPEVYHDIMKGIYSKTSQYEKYITGKLDHDAAIWFATHAKYDPNETKIDVREKSFEPKYFLEGPLNAAKTLRENNIPFEVIGSKNIRGEKQA